MFQCTLARAPFPPGAASFYPQVRAISKPSAERRTSVSGVAILTCAIRIGPRERFPQTTQRPNNLATNLTTHLSLNMAAQFIRVYDFVKRFNRAAKSLERTRCHHFHACKFLSSLEKVPGTLVKCSDFCN